MRDWIYGFFMAWGMFLAIPCPKKIWSESARRKMLACLPLVGIVVGAVWALAAWLAGLLPRPLGAALCAAAPWLTTGFLHLDGFMDVCDGILSRRDLETRRRILKDSHCGAFAVICMVLLAMALLHRQHFLTGTIDGLYAVLSSSCLLYTSPSPRD